MKSLMLLLAATFVSTSMAQQRTNARFEELKKFYENASEKISLNDFQDHMYFMVEDAVGLSPALPEVKDHSNVLLNMGMDLNGGSHGHRHLFYPQICYIAEFDEKGRFSERVSFVSKVTQGLFNYMKNRTISEKLQKYSTVQADISKVNMRSSAVLLSTTEENYTQTPITFENFVERMDGARTKILSDKEIQLDVTEFSAYNKKYTKPWTITFRKAEGTVIGEIKDETGVTGYKFCEPHDLVYCYAKEPAKKLFDRVVINYITTGTTEQRARNELLYHLDMVSKDGRICNPQFSDNQTVLNRESCVAKRAAAASIKCSKNIKDLNLKAYDSYKGTYVDFYKQ